MKCRISEEKIIFKIVVMHFKSIKFIDNFVRRVSTKPTGNGNIQPVIYNRNPRNLERLRIERKPTGYALDKDNISYWHKLKMIKYSKYVIAQLVHNSEKVVVEASTNEWCLRKHLFSMNDSMAYIVLGKVFAERCMESGIISFACPYESDSKQTTKLNLFLTALKSEGLMLKEPDSFDIHNIWFKKREKRPWTVLED